MTTYTQTAAVYPVTAQDILFYRIGMFDDFPHLRHAIFTRKGGVSQEPFDGLNLSISVGDNPEAVKKNSLDACRALKLRPDQTVSCHLVHGGDILTVTRSNRRPVMGKADGLITKERDIYLFVRFGDCTPLLFFDPVVNAVGLTHAGWRGVMANAAGATIEAMVNRLCCRPQNIVAVIGPAIGPCCYEVGPDVMAAAARAFAEPETLFERRSGDVRRAYFDLRAANRRQLAAAGVKQVIQSNICTACRTDEFFSHRAEQGRTGRFGVIIGLEAGLADSGGRADA